MTKIVVTNKYKISLKKFVRNNPNLQIKIEETIELMTNDLFSPELDILDTPRSFF